MAWPTSGLRRASVNSFGFGGSNSHVVLDDAYNFMKQRGLHGNHNTAVRPPQLVAPGSPVVSDISDTDSSSISDEVSVVSSLQTLLTPGMDEALNAFQFCDPLRLYVFSASSDSSLKQLTARYADHLLNDNSGITQSQKYLDSLAYTLSNRRSHLARRTFAVASSKTSLQTLLEGPASIISKKDTPPRLGFIFTGQGAQWLGMGRELMAYSVFSNSVHDADAYLRGLGADWSVLSKPTCQITSSKTCLTLIDYFSGLSSEKSIDTPTFSQTLCTILQIALIELLEHFGIKPSAVAGHSSGEIAAA